MNLPGQRQIYELLSWLIHQGADSIDADLGVEAGVGIKPFRT
jgi:hypothetical protein